ncbi:DUF58 domain-containing protein [Microbacterium koreense]|uniref:DUF58 domain-containing protein n=1 Tax=Microbacterium koreense TaxID=323761 RepID=A0ABW2ZQ69_9MICO
MKRAWPLTLRGTGALVLALACFALASELGIVELLYFGVLLTAVLVVSVAVLYGTSRADGVTRSLHPDVSSVGRESAVSAHVTLRTSLPTSSAVWRDTVPSGLRGEATGAFPALGSGLRGAGSGGTRTAELTYRLTGARRGVHSIGPMTVSSSDPFGLARRTLVFSARTAVTVAPAVIDLPPLADFSGESGGMLQTTTEQLGQGADNLVARPYVPGDSMRRIHWRATAHRDELMVRQEEQESRPEATVVLDRSALRWAAEAKTHPGVDPGFEAAVSLCVSAVARLVYDGYSVDVIDADGAVLAEQLDGADAADVEGLVTQFATLTTRRDDQLPTLRRVFAGVMSGPVVLIVGRFDAADAESVAPVAAHSALALLFAASPIGDALRHASESGWRAGSIDPDDLGGAWAAAVGRGVSRVS